MKMYLRSLLQALLIGLCWQVTVEGLASSSPPRPPHGCHPDKPDTATTSRRSMLKQCLLAGSLSLFPLYPANSACLPGDASKECIGVYKVPMDDEILGYVDTKSKLEANAPGLNYVPPIKYPKSVKEALEVLHAQREAVDDIRKSVTSGQLEEAGVKVLTMVPRVTASGRVVVQSMSEGSTGSAVDELRLSMTQSKLEETLTSFGQCDISIGQGIRGEVKSITAAQLIILAELKDAEIGLDDFLAMVKS